MKLKGGVHSEHSRGVLLSFRKSVVFTILVLLIFGTFLSTFGFIPLLETVKAATNNWDFSNAPDYSISDNTKLEISGGQARLKTTGSPDWYDANWKYRKEITIDNSAGGALTNYQVPVNLSDSNFDNSKALTNGEDIRFTDADGTTEINHWIENWYEPTLNQYSQRANTVGYWHFDSQASAYDSSGSANAGTYESGANIDSKSLSLEKDNSEYVAIPDSSTLDANSSFTIEAWIKPESLPSGDGDSAGIVTKGGAGESSTYNHNYWLALSDDASWAGNTGDGFSFGFEKSLGENYSVVANDTVLALGQWHHLVGVFDDVADELRLYQNGVLINTTAGVTVTPNNQAIDVAIGKMILTEGSTYFDGDIDEVRIIKSALTTEQVLADYNTSEIADTAKVWTKIPSIPAGASKTIYMYYGLTDNPNLEAGIISDVHGVADSGDKKGSFTTDYIGEFVGQMDNTFQPNFSVELGDKINNVSNAADKTNLTAIKNAFSGLDNDHYYTIGNHDLANVTRAEMQTALAIDYSHKSVDVGDYHVIIIDSQDGTTAGTVSNDEKTWLTAELAATDKKTLVFVHQVLDGQSVVLNQYFAGGANAYVSNAADVRTILENDGDVVGVFQGHTHWDNLKTINNIPYFTINSLVEDYAKEWAEVSVFSDRFINVVYRQGNLTKKVLIWDFVNNKFYNKADQVFDYFDDFDGDTGQWSEVTGADTGTWQIQEDGYLIDSQMASAHRLLKSTFTETSNYIAEMKVKYRAETATAGFAPRTTDKDNFNAFYVNDETTDVNDTYRWKQMVATTWSALLQSGALAEDLSWHNLKMVKAGDIFSLYDYNVSRLTGTDTGLEDNFFALWNYNKSAIFDNLIIRQYAAIEPTNSVGSEVLVYNSVDPSIAVVGGASQAFTSLSGFAETATKNGGEIKYQISNNAGTTWYWWTNAVWTETVGGYTEANTASVVNTNIGSALAGDFSFKAYLHSDGVQLVQLDMVALTYENDIVLPVITLIGESTTNIQVGDTYTDQGATALDDMDGDLTNNIVVTSNVNTAAAGTYTVTYNVSDSAGNPAIQITRTVVVAVATTPTVTHGSGDDDESETIPVEISISTIPTDTDIVAEITQTLRDYHTNTATTTDVDDMTPAIDLTPNAPTITNITAKGTALWIEGKADPDTIIHFTIHSNPFEGQGLSNKDGYWTYFLDNASDILGVGDHTIFATSSVKAADGTELTSDRSKTYDFKVSVDDGNLKVEMKKTRLWQIVSGVFGLIIILFIVFWILKRHRTQKY